MVSVTPQSHVEARVALRAHITESCRRDLTKVFVAWLLQEPEQRVEFASLAAQAAKREVADQDFQTTAILGFAAVAGLLSESEVGALKRGLSRLAGRSPVVNGVPMAFRADAVGILGVVLGTRAVADPVVTGGVVGWATKFLRSSYERGGAEDWQRCLFAVADRQLGGTLGLPVPESPATADVRTALAAKGLIEVGDGKKAGEDEVQTLALAIQEPPEDFTCERAALRLAALEWATRTPATPSESAQMLAQEARMPQGGRKTKKPVRRNAKYEKIDKALREFSAACPRNHEEVFQLLDDRKVPIPNRRPFKAAGGWLKGFHQNHPTASAWLSQAWGRLGLPAFARGPKK